jgi:Zn-dependent protease/CBS domain-containing protein
MMESTFKLGRVFGIPIGVHYTWFLVFFMLTYLLADQWRGPWTWVWAAGTSLLFFVSVLAHELSHSVVALGRGIPVRGITLFIFGGVAQITREAKTPMTEFLVAIAGPLCSLALAGVFFAVRDPLGEVSRDLMVMAHSLFYFNLVVGIFNMAPGFPMDGGRVFRAIIWGVSHNYQMATKVAIRAGQGIAILLIGLGIALIAWDLLSPRVGTFLNGVWTIFIGLYLGSAAFASYSQFQQREALRLRAAGEIMNAGCVAVPAGLTLMRLADSYGTPSPDAVFLVTQAGYPTGLLTGAAMYAVPKVSWNVTTIESVASPLDEVPTATPQLDALSVLELMEEKNAGQVLIVSNGSLLGYVARHSFRGPNPPRHRPA